MSSSHTPEGPTRILLVFLKGGPPLGSWRSASQPTSHDADSPSPPSPAGTWQSWGEGQRFPEAPTPGFLHRAGKVNGADAKSFNESFLAIFFNLIFKYFRNFITINHDRNPTQERASFQLPVTSCPPGTTPGSHPDLL